MRQGVWFSTHASAWSGVVAALDWLSKENELGRGHSRAWRVQVSGVYNFYMAVENGVTSGCEVQAGNPVPSEHTKTRRGHHQRQKLDRTGAASLSPRSAAFSRRGFRDRHPGPGRDATGALKRSRPQRKRAGADCRAVANRRQAGASAARFPRVESEPRRLNPPALAGRRLRCGRSERSGAPCRS